MLFYFPFFVFARKQVYNPNRFSEQFYRSRFAEEYKDWNDLSKSTFEKFEEMKERIRRDSSQSGTPTSDSFLSHMTVSFLLLLSSFLFSLLMGNERSWSSFLFLCSFMHILFLFSGCQMYSINICVCTFSSLFFPARRRSFLAI